MLVRNLFANEFHDVIVRYCINVEHNGTFNTGLHVRNRRYISRTHGLHYVRVTLISLLVVVFKTALHVRLENSSIYLPLVLDVP